MYYNNYYAGICIFHNQTTVVDARIIKNYVPVGYKFFNNNQ